MRTGEVTGVLPHSQSMWRIDSDGRVTKLPNWGKARNLSLQCYVCGAEKEYIGGQWRCRPCKRRFDRLKYKPKAYGRRRKEERGL